MERHPNKAFKVRLPTLLQHSGFTEESTEGASLTANSKSQAIFLQEITRVQTEARRQPQPTSLHSSCSRLLHKEKCMGGVSVCECV